MDSIAAPMRPSSLGDRIIKVNHAGEHGAISIYAGQIATAHLTARWMVSELREFQSHEKRHRAIFGDELRRRGQPRCRSYWLCGLGGYLLGLMTGLLGPSAIAATTVAVETVVLRHLERQMADLRGHDQQALAAISEILADEQQHHDRSVVHSRAGRLWPAVLTPLVTTATETVIWLGMRL